MKKFLPPFLMIFLSLSMQSSSLAEPIKYGNSSKWYQVMEDISMDEVDKIIFEGCSHVAYASAPTWQLITKSEDGGGTWINLNKGGKLPASATAFIVASTGYMYVGTDGGGISEVCYERFCDYSYNYKGLGGHFIYDLAADSADHYPTLYASALDIDNKEDKADVYYNEYDTKIFNHTGLNKLIKAGSIPRSINFDSQGNVYVIVDEKDIYKLSYSTKQWEKIGIVQQPAQKMLIDSHDHLYVITHQGIFKSTDNAKTWHPLNNGLTNLHINEAKFDAHENLYAATQAGVFILMKGSNQWGNFGLEPIDIMHLAIDGCRFDKGDEYIYAIGKSQIYKRWINNL